METVTMSLGVHITLIVLNETRAKIKQNQPTSKQTKTKEDCITLSSWKNYFVSGTGQAVLGMCALIASENT